MIFFLLWFGPTLCSGLAGLTGEQRSAFVLELLAKVDHNDLATITDAVISILRRDFIGCLPDELAEKVLLYVDAPTLAIVEKVSRGWQTAVRNNALWRKQFEQKHREDASWQLMSRQPGRQLPPRELTMSAALWKDWFRNYHCDIRQSAHNWIHGIYKQRKIDGQGLPNFRMLSID